MKSSSKAFIIDVKNNEMVFVRKLIVFLVIINGKQSLYTDSTGFIYGSVPCPDWISYLPEKFRR